MLQQPWLLYCSEIIHHQLPPTRQKYSSIIYLTGWNYNKIILWIIFYTLSRKKLWVGDKDYFGRDKLLEKKEVRRSGFINLKETWVWSSEM